VGAASLGVQRLLQHGAGPACDGEALVERPGEEGERGRGEVHHQIRQPRPLGPGDLLRPLEHADV